MNRADLITALLDDVGRMREGEPKATHRIIALAIVGLVHEHELARHREAARAVFERLRSSVEPGPAPDDETPAAAPPSAAGVECADCVATQAEWGRMAYCSIRCYEQAQP